MWKGVHQHNGTSCFRHNRPVGGAWRCFARPWIARSAAAGHRPPGRSDPTNIALLGLPEEDIGSKYQGLGYTNNHSKAGTVF